MSKTTRTFCDNWWMQQAMRAPNFCLNISSIKGMWMSSSETSSIIDDTTFRSFFLKKKVRRIYNWTFAVNYWFHLSFTSFRFLVFWSVFDILNQFVRIRLTKTTKWKSSAFFRKGIQKTSVRLSHLSRHVVFQIPLSIITQALRISAFIVINKFSMDESFIDYSTFTSKMYRGLNLQFRIHVSFLFAIDN